MFLNTSPVSATQTETLQGPVQTRQQSQHCPPPPQEPQPFDTMRLGGEKKQNSHTHTVFQEGRPQRVGTDAAADRECYQAGLCVCVHVHVRAYVCVCAHLCVVLGTKC